MEKVRVRTDNATFSRFLIGFIAGIIRSKFQQICKTLSLSTNEMIRECGMLEAKLLPGNVYGYIHTENKRQQALLKALNGSAEELEISVATKTNRINDMVSVKRKRKPGPKTGSHNNKYDEEGNIIPKKPGPKPGSHHKPKEQEKSIAGNSAKLNNVSLNNTGEKHKSSDPTQNVIDNTTDVQAKSYTKPQNIKPSTDEHKTDHLDG